MIFRKNKTPKKTTGEVITIELFNTPPSEDFDSNVTLDFTSEKNMVGFYLIRNTLENHLIRIEDLVSPHLILINTFLSNPLAIDLDEPFFLNETKNNIFCEFVKNPVRISLVSSDINAYQKLYLIRVYTE